MTVMDKIGMFDWWRPAMCYTRGMMISIVNGSVGGSIVGRVYDPRLGKFGWAESRLVVIEKTTERVIGCWDWRRRGHWSIVQDSTQRHFNGA
jgi:hypothetical protein